MISYGFVRLVPIGVIWQDRSCFLWDAYKQEIALRVIAQQVWLPWIKIAIAL